MISKPFSNSFDSLLSDLIRRGSDAETNDAIAEMEVFLAQAKAQSIDGGALSVADYERMETKGRMCIENARLRMIDDVLTAELEAAMANGSGDLTEDLRNRLMAHAARMMEGASPQADDTPPLAPDVQSLFDAIEAEDAAAVRTLAAPVDINARYGPFEMTPLYHAISGLGTGCAMPNLLLDLGADPTVGMVDGYTPLHAVAGKRFDDKEAAAVEALVRRLVAGGADIEARTESYGWTPVQYAVSELEETSLRALLLSGARVEPEYLQSTQQTCVDGPSTLDEAFAFPEVLSILLDFGADPHRRDAQGQSANDRLNRTIRRNREDTAAIVARGKTPDASEISLSEGYAICLRLMQAAARKT